MTIGSGTGKRVLEALPGTRFYREAPAAVDADLLLNGRRIRSDPYSFRLAGSGIHLLAENEEIPGWSSARRFGWGRPHVVIADAATADGLKALLERAAEPGYSGPRANGSLPEGWAAFRSVVPRPEATDAWAVSPLGQLLPIESARASLVNGLRLTRARIYLVGGEPDLVCPAETFELDGKRQTVVPGSVVGLRERHLAPGRHVVTVGAQSLRFAVARGSAGTPDPAEAVQLSVGPDASLAGAAAPSDWARERWTWPLKARQQCFAVGAKPGQLAKLERKPQVRRTVGRVWSILAEAEIPFEPVWIIVIDQRRGRAVTLANPRDPEPPVPPAQAHERTWAQLFLVPSPEAPALWRRYAEVAQEILSADGPR